MITSTQRKKAKSSTARPPAREGRAGPRDAAGRARRQRKGQVAFPRRYDPDQVPGSALSPPVRADTPSDLKGLYAAGRSVVRSQVAAARGTRKPTRLDPWAGARLR